MNPAASTAPHPPLRRTAADRVLLGVCGGLARTFDLRPLLVRIAVVLLGALAFPLVAIAYAAVALIVPRDDGRVLLGGAPADGREQLLGWGLVLLAGFLLLAAGFEPDQLVWPALSQGGLLLAGLGVAGLAVREGRRGAAPAVSGASAPEAPPAPAPVAPPAVAETMPAHVPAPSPATEPTLATAPVPVSRPAVPRAEEPTVRTAAEETPTVRIPPRAAAAEPVPAPAPARRPRSARRTVLLVTGVACLILAAIATAGVVAGAAVGGVGERSEFPVTAADMDEEYRLAVGAIDIDLRDTALPRGTTDLRARVLAGSVTIWVPPGVRVESIGGTYLDGIEQVNRAARAHRARLAARPAEATRAGASGASAAGGRAGRRAAGARRLPPPRTLLVDADVGFGSAAVIAAGG